MDTATGRRPSRSWRGPVEWLPRGGALGDDAWSARHRGICILLWLHAGGLLLAALISQQSVTHSVAEASAVAWLALGATLATFDRRVRSALATLGLMTSSALVVHLTNGLIEAHFHFFVMVAVVALYQAWQPYLLALAFVVLHHSVIGTFAPHAVYNHPAAADYPWLWGLIHGAFILAESAACLVYWRASEAAMDRERAARLDAELAHRELAEAQALSGVGSWEWDQSTQTVTWSDQLYALAGVDPETFTPTIEGFLELVHPEDRGRVAELLRTLDPTTGALDYECRILRPDLNLRTIHALGEIVDLGEGRIRIRGTCHDVTQRKQLEVAITRMALEDPLTGLANRRLFSERLQEAVTRSSGAGGVSAVLFIDLDGFKDVNDMHGHAAGDAVLQDVARRLKASVRKSDTIARFGGDEFAVLCDAADLGAVAETAARIEEELSYVAVIDGNRIRVRASVGFAVADSATSADGLLRRADEAMYAAKARGSSFFEVSGRDVPDEKVESRPPVLTDLELALVQDQFWLVYQPIVDLRSDEHIGVEALIRWMHPVRGLLDPAEFIDDAETSGHIEPIGEWALRAACNATAVLASDAYTSVNISARQLRLPRLAEVVSHALDTSGLPPERLVLEITETATVSDLAGAIARLKELKALGVKIALDDFGTGYSSLTYLRNFPVDILKIDRSFVRNVVRSGEDRAIVRGVIDIAHRLGMRTVAEGIEEPEQLHVMTDLGCDSGQGYLWTRPVALEALVAAR